ncbi:hypothetical protein [Chryseobacterium lathyri]|uniref:Uncharacterized protein n=1 Tax=Chryseobacterium lathyri TaxID=395933 RepID=A0ABT9SS81_9FLAO|nr:hypothetical protein [Chryseobacterium lathyri]MDP9961646.1 hypothetical protein [Chryseobacterium lathyri]
MINSWKIFRRIFRSSKNNDKLKWGAKKKEIAVLHEKNVQSAINEKTSSLQINRILDLKTIHTA